MDLASIYALTKYAQERAAMIFVEAYEVEAVALRLFNVFGPGQALSNPYTGVLANFGARLAMESPQAAGHVINVGSGRSYTIAGVAGMLAEAMGVPELQPEITGRARSGDIRNCFADLSRARELLGFRPERHLEDCQDELARWIRAEEALDRGPEMRRELEQRGLVT